MLNSLDFYTESNENSGIYCKFSDIYNIQQALDKQV